MTFAEIAKQMYALQHKAPYGGPAQKAWGLVCSAEENANDTVYADKTVAEAQWEQVALDTLEMLVADERDAKVRKIFTSRGFKF